MEITAQQLAAMVNGTVDGDATTVINNYAKIEEATTGCLTFLANPKYTHYIYTTEASAVLVSRDFKPEHEVKATLIRVDDPYKTLADLLNFVNSQRPEKRGVEQPVHVGQGTTLPDDVYVGAFAYIGDGVTIGKHVKIYPQVYVGDGVTLGDDVILYPGVKIYHGCRIGNRCIVQGGAVIGGDGFGFAPKGDGTYEKIAQVGIVILQDDVEIGANTTIDRATMGATVVKRGAKLDNLIQIAHNVEVGESTVMAAQVGVAGSYSMYNSIHQPLDPTLVPIIGNIMPNWVSSGEMSSHGSSFTVAPYFRYDVLTAGDVSLFIELSLFYTQMQNPTIDTAKVDNHMEVNGVPVVTSYFTWDTVGALVPRNSTTYGARVTPGLTWQLSKHCGIDLYLDFLSLAYSQTKSIDTRLDYSFKVSGTGTVTYDYTLTTVNTSSTDFGGALTGTPLLTKQGVNNWVRVGFNFTF